MGCLVSKAPLFVSLVAQCFDAFDDPTSPQFLALRWISRDTFQKGGSEAYTMGASIQRFALATIYFALKGPSTWLDNNLWLSTVVSVCEWKGVTCDTSNTSVSSLELLFFNYFQSLLPLYLPDRRKMKRCRRLNTSNK